MTFEEHLAWSKTRALLIASMLVITGNPAEACHRFSVWRYPTPQHCGVTVERDWYVEFKLPPSPLTKPDLRTPEQIREQAEHDKAIADHKDELNRLLRDLHDGKKPQDGLEQTIEVFLKAP